MKHLSDDPPYGRLLALPTNTRLGWKGSRVRPEPAQLERLSDASFLGKLLALPAKVRLDWKVIARYKHSSIFGLIIGNKEKSFITLTPGANVVILFSSPLRSGQIS